VFGSVACLATSLLVMIFSQAYAGQPPGGPGQPVSPGKPVTPSQPLPLNSGTYLIHPGDQLSVQVYGEPTLTTQQPITVLPDGTVDYPLVGRVAVAGKTTGEATQALRTKLLRYLRNPLVTVAVAQEKQYTVMVLGAVDHPGEIPIKDGERLSMVIAQAGNTTNANADLNHLRVTRTNADGTKTVSQVNLYDALVKGHPEVDMVLKPNDLVYVPEAAKHNPGVFSDLFLILRSLVPL